MYTYAEAVSVDGRILGKSDVQETILPNGLDGTLTDLTIPTVQDEATAEHEEKPVLPLARRTFGRLAVLFIATLLAFSLLGMTAMAYFLWNHKTLLSRGIYAPVTSSDTLDGSELTSMAYHDQEVEK